MLVSQSELHQSDTERYFSGGTVAECCDLTLTILSSSNVLGGADEPQWGRGPRYNHTSGNNRNAEV